jgi:hypothetical protein
MAKSIDKVLQPDGTYKWELVDSWDPSSERSAKPVEKPAVEKPAVKKPAAKKAKASKVTESTDS